ncbi:hypothetical protein AVEN_211320-1, partial [Araneus ventricosus]
NAPHQRLYDGLPTCDLTCNSPKHDGSSVESDFAPGTLQRLGRHLTTKPPRLMNKEIEGTTPHKTECH